MPYFNPGTETGSSGGGWQTSQQSVECTAGGGGPEQSLSVRPTDSRISVVNNTIEVKLEPHDQESSTSSAKNPFFHNVPFVKMNKIVHDEPDSVNIMDKIQTHNPTSFAPKYGGQRYFQGSYPQQGKWSRGRKQRQSVLNEGFVKFIPAGEKMQEEPREEVEITSTTQGMATPPAFEGFSRPVPPNENQGVKLSNLKKRAYDVMGPNINNNAAKKLKITPEKPATALLNEYSPNLDYVYEQVKESPKGPIKFLCKVTFPLDNGHEFVGQGRSKKLAKNDVATQILHSIGIQPWTSSDVKMEIDSNPPTTANPNPFLMEFYSNVAMSCAPSIDFASDDMGSPTPNFVATNVMPTVDITSAKRLQNIPDFENNSLCALNTLVGPESVEFEEVNVEGPAHDKKFSLTLHLKTNGQTFQGTGGSKKRAKAHAAKQALISVLSPNVYQYFVALSSPASSKKALISKLNTLPATDNNIPPELSKEWFNEDSNISEYDLTFSDYICRIVNEKYEELMAEHQAYISQKVLAGVVMTRCQPMLENGEVIAVTTGTKCVEGDFISDVGLAVNDSHAEVIATRCVRDFLYSQLENLIYATDDAERNESVLEELKNDAGETIFKLKDNVKFHLYVSTSPCGDARIFSPKGLETEEEKGAIEELEDSHPSKRNRGVLRAKVEAGEGTIPVANLNSGPQTFDSIVQGSALHTMSCSDKVCRWNVVGIQGALLSNLMLPVYYSSIILGSLHHPVHFRRAVLGRIESLAGKIPLPFKINRAHLLMVSHEEKRKVKKSPNHAVCWTLGWSTPEVLAASKGRCEPGGIPSRLAKRTMFMRFLKLYKNKTGRRDGFANLSYREAKMIANSFQTAKEMFRLHMQETNMGTWCSKPLEMDSFHISS